MYVVLKKKRYVAHVRVAGCVSGGNPAALMEYPRRLNILRTAPMPESIPTEAGTEFIG